MPHWQPGKRQTWRLPDTGGPGYVDTEVAAIKTKTDYLPSATAGAAGGLFIAGSNAATSITTALTANITGNLSGSVGSVTGAVGSVTGAVGSVTGAVGSVTGNAALSDLLPPTGLQQPPSRQTPSMQRLSKRMPLPRFRRDWRRLPTSQPVSSLPSPI